MTNSDKFLMIFYFIEGYSTKFHFNKATTLLPLLFLNLLTLFNSIIADVVPPILNFLEKFSVFSTERFFEDMKVPQSNKKLRYLFVLRFSPLALGQNCSSQTAHPSKVILDDNAVA